MFKNIIATTALLAASAALASAATVVSFNTNNTGSGTVMSLNNTVATTAQTVTISTNVESNAVLSIVSSAGKWWNTATTPSLWTNSTATDALAEYGISLDGIVGGVSSGSAGNTTTITISGLTAGHTYTLVAVVAEAAGSASTFSITTGTVVSGTYYDLSTSDSGTEFTSSGFSITGTLDDDSNLSDDAGTAVIADITASSDGTIVISYTVKGTTVLLSLIPEPSAFGLLAGVGALALAASRRRRTRKA